jgi:hypothetical protein
LSYQAAHCEQNGVGLEVRYCVRDDRQDTATAGRSAGVDTDRVHVAQHGVEALVDHMPAPIDIVRSPRKPPRKGGREHVDLGRCFDDLPRRWRQLGHLSDCGVGDEQDPWTGPAALMVGFLRPEVGLRPTEAR